MPLCMPALFSADALYFQALEGGTSFAILNQAVISPDYHFHFGARIKGTWLTPHDCFELSLEFLHYHARTRQSIQKCFPLFGFAGDELVETNPMWRLHLGLLDLLLGREWKLSNCTALRPFFGLRYGEIRHKWKQDDFLSMKNKFWGVGPKMGIEGNWLLNSYFGIFGKSAFSLLYGKFYVHQDIEELNLLDENCNNVGIWEMGLGVFVQKGCFQLQGGYELYWFPGQNQLNRFVDLTTTGKFVANQGSLFLHGLSFGASVYF